MSFGKNLQFLRRMRGNMTQEALAEKMQVSRQTVSKWELDAAFPEMDKAMELCRIFSCTLDNLFREDMGVYDDCYENLRVETVPAFRYIRYAVISMEPEDDAIGHVRKWAESCGIKNPDIIGWDFPVLSQEQINVYHMHGYAAAWVLPPELVLPDENAEIITQNKQKYAIVTIRDPMSAPFRTIPNGYKTLMSYMQVNGIEHTEDSVIPCFEREYEKDGIGYMDVYIAAK